MKVSYLPAVRVDFTAQDGRPDKTVYRPFAALSFEELTAHTDRAECGAFLELGERYYFGTGVSQDYAKAIEYLTKAAELGAQDAEYLIAECYRCGYGVQKNYETYFDWIFRAAEHGSWMAMFNVAAAYNEGKKVYDGFGVDVDLSQALAWMLEAEASIRCYWDFYNDPACVDMLPIKRRLLKAYVRAAMQLSEHYANGMGTARDRSRAFYWLNRAKRFVGKATGLREIPMIDNAIAKMKERMDGDVGKR